MLILGVLDLLDGRAVHARGGHRERYAPVIAVGHTAIPSGDPQAVARAYLVQSAVPELYVADLNAILGRARQDATIENLVALGAPVWLDAGITSTRDARRVVDLGVRRVVVGLETLRSFDLLERICIEIGGDRVAFSLDLRNGQPVVMADGDISPDAAPETLAQRAMAGGAGAVIVLDLARVGTGAGLDVGLMSRLRAAAPKVIFAAGGGVAGFHDLDQLAKVGCDAALIATALHDGRITPADVRAARSLTALGARHPAPCT